MPTLLEYRRVSGAGCFGLYGKIGCMHNLISWTEKLPEGVKREVRVHVSRLRLKWQFKRSDAEAWDYDSAPLASDWERLIDTLRRRARRGQAPDLVDAIKRLRDKAGV